MGRIGALFAALGVGGVAGAILNPDVQSRAFDRAAQVAADVGGKGLEGGNVEGVQAGGRLGPEFGEGRQESGKGLAAAGGGDQQGGGVIGAGQHIPLMRVQGPALGGEPLVQGGGKGGHDGKIGRGRVKGKRPSDGFCGKLFSIQMPLRAPDGPPIP